MEVEFKCVGSDSINNDHGNPSKTSGPWSFVTHSRKESSDGKKNLDKLEGLRWEVLC